MKIISFSALALLAACSGGTSDRTETRSTPEAATVPDNRAAGARDNGVVAAAVAPDPVVQNAIPEPGEAEDGVKQAPVPGPKPTVSPDR